MGKQLTLEGVFGFLSFDRESFSRLWRALQERIPEGKADGT